MDNLSETITIPPYLHVSVVQLFSSSQRSGYWCFMFLFLFVFLLFFFNMVLQWRECVMEERDFKIFQFRMDLTYYHRQIMVLGFSMHGDHESFIICDWEKKSGYVFCALVKRLYHYVHLNIVRCGHIHAKVSRYYVRRFNLVFRSPLVFPSVVLSTANTIQHKLYKRSSAVGITMKDFCCVMVILPTKLQSKM